MIFNSHSVLVSLIFIKILQFLMPKVRPEILNLQYLIPFGRFRLDRLRTKRSASILVGREGQRAFFIDALSGIGTRGAFLITGHRGVGKTTFVESCLKEYQQNVFRRFLSSGNGRSFPDLVLLGGALLAILASGLIAMSLLEFLVAAFFETPVLLLPILLLTLILAAPLVFSLANLRILVELYSAIAPTIIAGLALFLLAACALVFPAAGSPVQFASLLLWAIGVHFVVGRMFSMYRVSYLAEVNDIGKPQDRSRTFRGLTIPLLSRHLFFVFGVPVLAILIGYYLLLPFVQQSVVASLTATKSFADLGEQTPELASAVILGATGVGFVFSLYGVSVFKPEQEPAGEKDQPFRHLRSIALPALLVAGYLLLALLADGIRMRVFFPVFVAGAAFSIATSLIVLADLWRSRNKAGGNHAPLVFVPPFEGLLLLKVASLLVISMQFLYPVTPLFFNDQIYGYLTAKAADEGQDGRTKIDALCEDTQLRWNKSLLVPGFDTCKVAQKITNPDKVAYVTLFGAGKPGDIRFSEGDAGEKSLVGVPEPWPEELIWIAFAFLLFLAIFVLEFEWINRPFITQRQARSINRGARDPRAPHHHFDPVWLETWLAVTGAKPEESKGCNNKEQTETKESQTDSDEKRKSDTQFVHKLRRNALWRFRAIQSVTIPYQVARFWLPAVIVRVNLGFDNLDHRGVTYAMLYGLRREYARIFLSPRSSYRLISTFVLVMSVLALTVTVSRGVIDMPQVGNNHYEVTAPPLWSPSRSGVESIADRFLGPDPAKPGPYEIDICRWLAGIEFQETVQRHQASLPRALCALSPGFAQRSISFLFTPLFRFDIDQDIPSTNGASASFVNGRLAFHFVHLNNGLPILTPNSENAVQKPSLSLRIYHGLVAFLAFLLLRKLSFSLSPLPYRRTLRQIDELIDALTLRRNDRTLRQARFAFGTFTGTAGQAETERQLSRDELDPRSVELALLSLLNDLRHRPNPIPGHLLSGVSIPTPDMHFVFDELDKVGGLVGADMTQHGVTGEERDAVDLERSRTYKLHGLLSDMKRVISSAPARFIFVGGRSLHDEWIRDQNRLGSRQPLLTSIFDAELYLPSLLVDLPRGRYDNAGIASYSVTDSEKITTHAANLPAKRLDARIVEFIVRMHESATNLDKEISDARMRPFFGTRVLSTPPDQFEDRPFDEASPYDAMQVIDWRAHKIFEENTEDLNLLADATRDEFLEAFAGFLAYRSAGAPKKLKELISVLVRPSASFATPAMDNWRETLNSTDMLVLDQHSLYRIQFINSIFRHLERSLGSELLDRNDKIIINTIFLLDFLMKLHGRAFSWSTLERMDELAHIHRAPDLRRLFDIVVTNSAERYFHRVLNGLYKFRFRSEFTVEIRYLSRISEEEMAAMNFTLDESQELKTTYSSLLNASGEPNVDLVSALGELYEYDQSYEVARGHYERALRMVDREFQRQAGTGIVPGDPVPDAIAAVLDKQGAADVDGLVQAASLGSAWHGPMPIPSLRAVVSGERKATETVRAYVPWIVRRLRLMMQIGLTFEQAGDDERAQAEYNAAQVFARAVLDTAFGEPDGETTNERRSQEARQLFQQVLKHLSLIYQPLFASAWVAEKTDGGVDTSLSIVEIELALLRARVPFVRDLEATNTSELAAFRRPEDFEPRYETADSEVDSPALAGGNANHALMVAELHNKAGDLYFYKGRVPYQVTPEKTGSLLKERITETARERAGFFDQGFSVDGSVEGREGYLLRAHYHYAVALHDVRRYLTYRLEMSRSRLNIALTNTVDITGNLQRGRHRWNTFDRHSVPSFVAQTAHSSLVDFAEVMLSRSSVLAAWNELGKSEDIHGIGLFVEVEPREFIDQVVNWFTDPDEETRKASEFSDLKQCVYEALGAWKGGKADSASRKRLLGFGKVSSNTHRILMSLLLSMSGARFAAIANYPDNAGFEYQIASEHALRHLRSIRTLLFLRQAEDETEEDALTGKEFAAGFDTRFTTSRLEFIKLLLRLGVDAMERQWQMSLLAYPKETTDAKRGVKPGLKRGEIGLRVTVMAAATLSEYLLVISSLRRALMSEMKEGGCALQDSECAYSNFEDDLKGFERSLIKLLAKWIDDDAMKGLRAYQIHAPSEENRKKARAILLYLVTRQKFPILSNLRALKALVDDSLIEDAFPSDPDGEEKRKERYMQAQVWLKEINQTEKTLDAPLHFPQVNLAESLALLAVGASRGSPRRPDLDLQETFGLARRYRWRAEQAFSMGRQYYANISRLNYLFDDFNDRRLHMNHASQMAMADMLALLRHAIDERSEADDEADQPE